MLKGIISTTLLLLSSSLVFAQVDSEVKRLSEPVRSTSEFEIFGADYEFEKSSPELLTEAIDSRDENVLVLTKISQVCEKKGCFFIAQEGETTARVTFKDYSFFIPTNSMGKEVVLNGVLTVKELTEEQAKHYAEDAGENPEDISGPQKEFSIVATSVLIPKK